MTSVQHRLGCERDLIQLIELSVFFMARGSEMETSMVLGKCLKNFMRCFSSCQSYSETLKEKVSKFHNS